MKIVPLQVSRDLRSIGFNEPCLTAYDGAECLCSGNNQVFLPNRYNTDRGITYSAAPTYEETFEWFRDTHNMYTIIDIDRTTYPKFLYTLYQYRDGEVTEIPNNNFYHELYRKYEESELEAIIEMTEIIKDGRKLQSLLP